MRVTDNTKDHNNEFIFSICSSILSLSIVKTSMLEFLAISVYMTSLIMSPASRTTLSMLSCLKILDFFWYKYSLSCSPLTAPRPRHAS